MTTIRRDDPNWMVLLPHTPREDATKRDYETWLREFDNPFFNSFPGVAHYANWRICAPSPAVPYTHVDFLRIASADAALELARNMEVTEFGAEWTRLWARYPDARGDDRHVNGHLYLCRRLAGHRSRTQYASYQPAVQEPTDGSTDAEVWEVVQAVIGDARFQYLRVVPRAHDEDDTTSGVQLPVECLGAAMARLIASPDMAKA